MNKIGILGGTFDPIHNGHVMLARAAIEQYSLNKVIFIPCGKHYLKENVTISEGKLRLEMVKIGIEGEDRFEVSSIEIEKGGKTYTCETLLELKSIYPDTEFYFIIGADCLYSLPDWKNPRQIFANCQILVAVRDDKDYSDLEEQRQFLRDAFGARISILKTEKLEISSTDIRKKIKQKESVQGLLSNSVLTFIKRHKLYENR